MEKRNNTKVLTIVLSVILVLSLLAAAGIGDLVCIKNAPLPAKAHLTFIPLTPERHLDHYMIWRKGVSLSEPAQRLVNHLRSQLSEQ